jgi:hypothetical protein
MQVKHLLRAIEKLRKHGLTDETDVVLQVFQKEADAVAEEGLNSVNLDFEENRWSTSDDDLRFERPPVLLLVATEYE